MIIDGKKIAAEYRKEIQDEIKSMGGRPPGLAVILVGKDPASETYVKNKQKACSEVGIVSKTYNLDENIEEAELLATIQMLNLDPEIDGILVQQPLPDHLNTMKIVEEVLPEKDVDGFHPLNLGRVMIGDPRGFVPCTPLGILKLMEKSNIDPDSKRVVIVGRSNIVGKPLASLLMQKRNGCNATVTVVHSKSQNFHKICAHAEILITAIGKPEFITDKYIQKGAIVIDVGINRVTQNGKSTLVGDVDFEKASQVASQITPVPGGVGPMTIAMLLYNTLKSRKNR
ncbi:MAG: bifunctional methylenetetrahydrofolate dehydrogenase/methenyltetrahydrofolate cyclohydrolase FolD [Rhabdochlamydiaceae bacterium]|nr:bifunctional methylenetetrahydrofolate dehydrogenase/methenyltetrahydrofolate cyclohydrolase FolD [Candidatus Amphrikana amoebophyrae]